MLLTNGELSGAINFPEPPDYTKRRIDMSTFSYDDPRLYEEFVAGSDGEWESATALVAYVSDGLLATSASDRQPGTIAVHGNARMFDLDSITLDIYYNFNTIGAYVLSDECYNEYYADKLGKETWAELYAYSVFSPQQPGKPHSTVHTFIDYPELPEELVEALASDNLIHFPHSLDEFPIGPITVTIPAEKIKGKDGNISFIFSVYRQHLSYGEAATVLSLIVSLCYAVKDGKFIVTDYPEFFPT
jgi:hypothetical protein